MSRERRYWRPETEKLLAALGTVRDMEMKRLMVQPVVIQATEQERKQMEERFLDQMIQPVDFSSMTSAMVPEVTLEDLIRTIEEYERQVAIDKEAQEFLKELERLAYGYDLKPFPTQPAMSDLYNYWFWDMDERMTVEVLAVYEPRRKKE